jgi:hypothetical protein
MISKNKFIFIAFILSQTLSFSAFATLSAHTEARSGKTCADAQENLKKDVTPACRSDKNEVGDAINIAWGKDCFNCTSGPDGDAPSCDYGVTWDCELQ